MLYIDTCESDFDTVLGIFNFQTNNIYEPESISYMDKNDDGACPASLSPTGSTLVVQVFEGLTYFIVVDGFTESSAGN